MNEKTKRTENTPSEPNGERAGQPLLSDRLPVWDELTEEQKEKWTGRATYILRDLWHCTRTWEAWSVGTMTRGDFVSADSTDEFILEVAQDMYSDYCKDVEELFVKGSRYLTQANVR